MCCPHWGQENLISGISVFHHAAGGHLESFHDDGVHAPFTAGPDEGVKEVRGPDYLLTWNCRHLANAQILRRLGREARRAGRLLPQVCTPLELMGDYPYEDASAS
jgi:hypothetical protein